jgi:hypothetical protein
MILRNFIVTLPSIIYHGTLSLVSKFRHDSKKDIIFNTVDSNNLILLVHGYHGHPCNFTPLINNLCIDSNIKDNWNIIAVNLNQFEKYEDNTVQNEASYILQYIQNCNFENIILIGLSKGGLVCATAYAMNSMKIKKVITICSPLKGTRSCDLYLPKILDIINGNLDSVRNDLGFCSSTSSNTLNLLADTEVNYKNIFHIVPTYDHMIYPSTAALYPFVPNDNVFIYTGTMYSHIGVPFNKEIANVIIKWINQNNQ